MGVRLLFALSLIPLGLCAAETPLPADRWAADMKWFDQQDARRPCAPGGVVFVGSSSIRLWDLAKSFPKAKPLNRGFGGSHISDSVAEVDRLVVRHRPRVVVLYAGDNDLAAGKSVEQIVKDYEAFVAAVRAELPETKIVYIGIKPSLSRWRIADEALRANAALKESCEKCGRCEFVDVWAPMLGEDGTPRKELFVFDGLHMTPEGYAIWTALVGPHIE